VDHVSGRLEVHSSHATLGAWFWEWPEYAILMMERFYEELHNVGDPYEA